MTQQEAGVSPVRPPAIRRRLHRIEHAECPFEAATWGACDKARDEVYTDWQAMQQVILAYRIALTDTKPYRRGDTTFHQLVRYIAGEQEDITTKDGNANVTAWVMRLRAAIARFIAGDLPSYNLYTIPGNQPE